MKHFLFNFKLNVQRFSDFSKTIVKNGKLKIKMVCIMQAKNSVVFSGNWNNIIYTQNLNHETLAASKRNEKKN